MRQPSTAGASRRRQEVKDENQSAAQSLDDLFGNDTLFVADTQHYKRFRPSVRLSIRDDRVEK